MKKQYQNPCLEITELFLHTGICSNPSNPSEPTGSDIPGGGAPARKIYS